MKRQVIATLIAILLAGSAFAQQSRTQQLINAALKGWEIELRLGYNLGGTAPIPLPVEIRSINSYSPSMGFSLEANVSKWIDPEKKWGIIWGVKLENKNMETDATVKNYGMEIVGDGGELVKGRWTGGVKTSVKNSFLTFPILGAYKIHPRTNLKFGVFLSYLIEQWKDSILRLFRQFEKISMGLANWRRLGSLQAFKSVWRPFLGAPRRISKRF